MNNVFDVAEYILAQTGPVSTVKLQKLVYYSQAYSLAWDGQPLFDEDFEAWANGPVAPVLYNAHRGEYMIDPGSFKDLVSGSAFQPDMEDTMNSIIKNYGNKSPLWLSELTHNEDPWKNARTGYAPGESCKNLISKKAMTEYYSSFVEV